MIIYIVHKVIYANQFDLEKTYLNCWQETKYVTPSGNEKT